MVRVAIFASGAGTNAARIIEYFGSSSDISIDLVITNRKKAGVIEVAKGSRTPIEVISKETFSDYPEAILSLLDQKKIGFIVLAGFLLKIPKVIIKRFDERILNIHPSLLPSFGGPGMYGDHVHNAVLSSNQKVTGITIHKVNEEYDKGEIVFQKEVSILPYESLESLKSKIHSLEYENFPVVIEETIKKLVK
ncbi:MAG: phosphoribosylglycinamide formyltransferase [Bacteroidota bacterium]